MDPSAPSSPSSLPSSPASHIPAPSSSLSHVPTYHNSTSTSHATAPNLTHQPPATPHVLHRLYQSISSSARNAHRRISPYTDPYKDEITIAAMGIVGALTAVAVHRSGVWARVRNSSIPPHYYLHRTLRGHVVHIEWRASLIPKYSHPVLHIFHEPLLRSLLLPRRWKITLYRDTIPVEIAGVCVRSDKKVHEYLTDFLYRRPVYVQLLDRPIITAPVKPTALSTLRPDPVLSEVTVVNSVVTDWIIQGEDVERAYAESLSQHTRSLVYSPVAAHVWRRKWYRPDKGKDVALELAQEGFASTAYIQTNTNDIHTITVPGMETLKTHFPKYTHTLMEAEALAKRLRRGMWANLPPTTLSRTVQWLSDMMHSVLSALIHRDHDTYRPPQPQSLSQSSTHTTPK